MPNIFDPSGRAKHDEKSVAEMINDGKNIVFSAVVDGVTVGYAIAVVKHSPDNPVMRKRTIFYVDDLCVDPALQHGGIGRALMDACVNEARALGCDTLELNVWEGNADARHFYEAYGMKTQRRQMEMEIVEQQPRDI